MVGRTTLVVAHRLSTVRALDRLLVLDRGKVIEEGSHDALIRIDGGIYRRLFERQALELAKGLIDTPRRMVNGDAGPLGSRRRLDGNPIASGRAAHRHRAPLMRCTGHRCDRQEFTSPVRPSSASLRGATRSTVR